MSSPSQPSVTAAPPITPGTVLAGKYRVERIIGQGGMGLVVEARHLALDERVALKFLLPEYASHPEASSRFLREARAAVKIKSAHVARVSDVGTLESGAPYMVMEFLEGSDVSGLLEKSGVLAVSDAVDYTIQACEAIAEAHSYGIVHRDLKPANMFVTRHRDGAPLVKVLDFGISKVMGGGGVEALTRTTAAMGSALYMSPEQMQSTRSVDHRTDIYALGVALYEMLAGKQPYYADTLPQLCAEILTGTPTPLRSVRPDVPDHFAWTIEKAYARDRAQRYQSVADLVVALAPYAPARTQPTIDRISRIAGLTPPIAGAPPAVPARPVSGAVGPGPAPTQVLPQGGFGGGPPQAGPGGGAPGGVAPHPGRVSDPIIVPGPYSAPASANAAAAFAANASTTDLSAAGVPRSSGKAGLFIGLSVAGLLTIGILAFVLLRGGKGHDVEPENAGQPPNTAETAAPVPPPASAPSAVETAAPVPSASATASAAPAETAATTARPGTHTPVGGKHPAATAAPTTKPTAGPTTPPVKKGADDYR